MIIHIDHWLLPGGKVREGEQSAEAAVRELKEELGFEVRVERVVHAWMHTIAGSQDESGGVLVLSYLCTLISKNGTFELEGEAGEARFEKFTLEEMKNLNM